MIFGKSEILDLKDKVVVIKSDRMDFEDAKKYYDGLKEMGCIGLIFLPSDAKISTLDKDQIKDFIRQLEGL